MNGALESLNGCLPVKAYTGIQTSSELSVASPPAPGVKTDLYDYHAEGEHVRFLCDLVSSHENLWRGPPRSIPLGLSYMDGVHSTSNYRKPEIRQAGVASMVNKNIGLDKGYRYSSM